MAIDLKISERIGRAISKGLEEDPSMVRMSRRLLALAAGLVAGMGDEPIVCEQHFIAFAQSVYRYARNPPIVECRKCGQKNRLAAVTAKMGTPICAVCKSSLVEPLTEYFDPPATPPSSN